MKRVLTIITALIWVCVSCTRVKCSTGTPGNIPGISNTIKGVTVSNTRINVLEFNPDSARAGIVFYPGAFIDYRCYAPLAATLAQKGFLCILPKPLCNVALLNKNIAVKLKAEHPEVTRWYIGGHSFGGSIAAMCLKNLPPDYQEVIIEGGNHCYFGEYGDQDGDGIATITRAEQRCQTVEAIFNAMFGN